MPVSDAKKLELLLKTSLSLTAAPDLQRIFSILTNSVQSAVMADGATLYLLNDNSTQLEGVCLRNNSLGINTDDGSAEQLRALKIPLTVKGAPNTQNLVAQAVINQKLVSVADRSKNSNYDFSGAAEFDRRFGYNSVSFLTIPLINSDGKLLGALQLINALDVSGQVIPFDKADAIFAKGVASLAATAITNNKAIADLEQLFEHFAHLLSSLSPALEERVRRLRSQIPMIALHLSMAMHADASSHFASFRFTESSAREINIACWLRDWARAQIESISNEQSSEPFDLESVYVALIETRSELIIRDIKLEYYAKKRADRTTDDQFAVHKKRSQLAEDAQTVIAQICNEEPFDKAQVETIGARYQWKTQSGEARPFLSVEEIKALIASRQVEETIQVKAESILEIFKGLRVDKYLGEALAIAQLDQYFSAQGYGATALEGQQYLQNQAIQLAEHCVDIATSNPTASSGELERVIKSQLQELSESGKLDGAVLELFLNKRLFSGLLTNDYA